MVLLSSNFVDWSTASGITNSGDDLNHAPGITSTPSTIMIYRTTCTPSTILIYWITWSKSPTSSLSSNLPVVVPVPAPSSEQPTTFIPLAPFSLHKDHHHHHQWLPDNNITFNSNTTHSCTQIGLFSCQIWYISCMMIYQKYTHYQLCHLQMMKCILSCTY